MLKICKVRHFLLKYVYKNLGHEQCNFVYFDTRLILKRMLNVPNNVFKFNFLDILRSKKSGSIREKTSDRPTTDGQSEGRGRFKKCSESKTIN